MSRWHIDRHVEREEDRLASDLDAGLISRAEYSEELRLLHREARDAEEEAYQHELDDLNAAWGRS